MIASVNKIGFVLTVPAKRKFKFMNAPANKAGTVAIPTIKPRPTSNSPKGIRMLISFTFGKAKPSKNAAYQPCTAGLSPVAVNHAVIHDSSDVV